jgi:hypothetical protein
MKRICIPLVLLISASISVAGICTVYKPVTIPKPLPPLIFTPAPHRDIISCEYAGPDLCRDPANFRQTILFTDFIFKAMYLSVHKRSLVITQSGDQYYVFEVSR